MVILLLFYFLMNTEFDETVNIPTTGSRYGRSTNDRMDLPGRRRRLETMIVSIGGQLIEDLHEVLNSKK